MKQHPILFSELMVQAILDGRKTMTRRVMKVQPEAFCGGVMRPLLTTCPYGWIGDHLWVRETWAYDEPQVIYRCGYNGDKPPSGKWKPSIFMPRCASRITLEITGVRVERLQDITEEDAVKEGFETTASSFNCSGLFAREHFMNLWDFINGKKYPWSANPWVWVIEYKRI